ncbi:hypothetical protein KR059_009281, partial [Drosophila kikkawai]
SGENNPAVRKPPGKLPRTDSECQFQAPGLKFLAERSSNLAKQVLVLEPSKPIPKELKNKCNFFPKYVDAPAPFKDQITQTLYRESSAQTLAYLPEPYATETNPRELFILPSILPGDKPPGLYEVEVFERSRRRWSFYEAVKINRKRLQISENNLRLEKYKSAVEAFEWEHWIQREEYIQECQMMRLQILIKMFDKREREIHAASKARIEMACERIEKRRQEALRKNEIAYQRGIRRLNYEKQRKWKKETPMEALGLPYSDFYGPQMRYGVDSARRQFSSKTGQRTFDLRIDELEKRVIARSLRCPFQKLNLMSKPKQYLAEAERNICNEQTLQSLYNSLKYLRQAGEAEVTAPRCRKVKFHYAEEEKASFVDYKMYKNIYDRNDEVVRKSYKVPKARSSRMRSFFEHNAYNLVQDQASEAMHNMISSYEGTAIGLCMQFLWEETIRLQQLRKLHFINLLAEKERKQREALEAGFRQKESDFRFLYEEIYQNSVRISNNVTDKYISSILTDDVDSIAGLEAADTVTELAKQIDVDIDRWLESFKLIQNPLTYIPLRVMLRDMVSPDLDAELKRHEKHLIAQYIVEDVIFGRVWEELEPFDVANTLTSDFIDRLIDNDLYLFSTDSECESPRKTSWYEAHAIIRKLIRQSVPGKRWKEETERNVYEIYNDLLDDIFAEIIFNAYNLKPHELTGIHTVYPHRHLDMDYPIKTPIQDMPSDLFDSGSSHYINTQVLSLIKKNNRLSV